jgi:peptidoglycan/xylan/chitin deacetylase (PgdA/CDA1 family)
MIVRRFLACLACCAVLGVVPVGALAQTRDIALSFDDGFDPREQPEAAAWNAAMLDALAYAEVRAILFPDGHRVDTPQGLALVKAWGDAGHAIGNHTYAHESLGVPSTTADAFEADVARAEALLQDMPGFTRRLRFPYLKEGESAAKRDAVRDWLAAHDYRSGAVTVDTSDWYYDIRYRAWLAAHPGGDPTPFRRAYLAHVTGRVAYYDALARRVLQRSDVKHVMLLHCNALNAAFLPDVIAMLRAQGWTIVRPGAAFDDPVHAMRPSTLPAGESVLWSLAKQQGATDLRYPAEEDIYEKPILDALGL